jgi:molybdopterin biosynthesis enzyme MoaB
MRAEGRRHTPLASLSRSLGAVRGQTLILCLPGSPKGALESLAAVETILAHTLETLEGRTAHS